MARHLGGGQSDLRRIDPQTGEVLESLDMPPEVQESGLWGIDLMDLPRPILPNPERLFCPRQPRISAASRRRDRGEHFAVQSYECYPQQSETDADRRKLFLSCSYMRGDIDRAQGVPVRRIGGVQLVS